jgi:predicted MFS family arabinose efflux permease
MYLGWLMPVALMTPMKSMRWGVRSLRFVTLLFLIAVASAILERSGVFTTTNAARAILGMPLGIFPAVMILFAIERLKEVNCSTSPRP